MSAVAEGQQIAAGELMQVHSKRKGKAAKGRKGQAGGNAKGGKAGGGKPAGKNRRR
jgi:hypothetical protein